MYLWFRIDTLCIIVSWKSNSPVVEAIYLQNQVLRPDFVLYLWPHDLPRRNDSNRTHSPFHITKGAVIHTPLVLAYSPGMKVIIPPVVNHPGTMAITNGSFWIPAFQREMKGWPGLPYTALMALDVAGTSMISASTRPRGTTVIFVCKIQNISYGSYQCDGSKCQRFSKSSRNGDAMDDLPPRHSGWCTDQDAPWRPCGGSVTV